MTLDEVKAMLERNKCIYITLFDIHGNKLLTVDVESTKAAINELEENLPSLTGYKRMQVLGKTRKKGTAEESYKYDLEMPGNKGNVAVAAPVSTGIGAVEHVNAIIGMMEKNNTLLQENMKLQFAQKQQDPAQWLPIIREAVGFLRGAPAGGIAGTNTLVRGEMKQGEKLSAEELGKRLTETEGMLAKKMQGEDFLCLLDNLNKMPDLELNIKKINALLETISAKPALLDMALTYIK